MEEKKMFKKSLSCNLTDEELLAYSKDLAKASQDKEGTDRKRKEVADDYKAQLTKLDAEISILSRKIGNGYEHRDIDCYWLYDWTTGRKSLIRTDTAEIVQVSAIEESEKQKTLALRE